LAQQTFPEQIATLSKQKEKVYGITKITYYRKQEQQ
jgi:16S rRNA (guanine966-N2)-methyltransferase